MTENLSVSPKMRLFAFWLPLVFFIAALFFDLVLSQDAKHWLYNENGPYELTQFFVLLWAAVLAACNILKFARFAKFLTIWMALAFVSCLWVAGEEVSWGQQFLEWNTPEFWSGINDQNETNLHNTSSWLDQKPRLILELGIYFGGIVLPLLRKYKEQWVPQKFNAIYPAQWLMPVAAFCLLIRLIDILADFSGLNLFGRVSEVEELYLYYFVALYLLDFRYRLVSKEN